MSDFSTVPVPVDGNGMVDLPLAIAADPGFAGSVFALQWFVADPAAPRPIKVSMSDSMKLVIGL